MDSQPALNGRYGALLLDMLELSDPEKQDLLKSVGIRPALLSSHDAFLSIEQSEALILKVMSLSGREELGLEFGERLNLMTHGALGQAVLSCNTLEQAIELLLKYYRTRMVHAQIKLSYEDDLAILSFDFEQTCSRVYQFLIETLFVCLVRTSMFFFGMKLLYQGQVQLSYPKPEYQDAYRSAFYEGASFNAHRNALCFKKELLSLPMAMPNASALKQAEQACNELLARVPQQRSVIKQVKSLMFSPEGELASLEELASMLHMSSRTLRRKLTAEGGSYRELLDQVRYEQACRLLKEEYTVDQVAEALNYSDPSNFGRAFKRRSGISPSAYRSQKG